MVDLEKEIIYLEGKREEIKEWQVWWISPNGLHQSLQEAKLEMEKLGAELLMLRPVSVAVSDTLYEMMMR